MSASKPQNQLTDRPIPIWAGLPVNERTWRLSGIEVEASNGNLLNEVIDECKDTLGITDHHYTVDITVRKRPPNA